MSRHSRLRAMGCTTVALLGSLYAGVLGSTPAPAAAEVAESARPSAAAAQLIPPDVNVRQGITGVTLTPRSWFPDRIEVLFRITVPIQPTHVRNVWDPSDAVLQRVTFEHGGSAGWHMHSGPAIIIVQSGTMGIVDASDCVVRQYQTGQALVDPGGDHVHVGFNAAFDGELVVYALFLDVPPGLPVSSPAPDPGCF